MPANVSTTALDAACVEDQNFIPCFKEDLVERLRNKMPSEDALEEARILFNVLSDRARLKILCAFQDDEELCVCDVAHVLRTTISTASHHLRKMRDLKLLKYRTDGKMAYYSLRNEYAGRLAMEVIGQMVKAR
jgi:DNA-binding transcriptional ArsR family regulator